MWPPIKQWCHRQTHTALVATWGGGMPLAATHLYHVTSLLQAKCGNKILQVCLSTENFCIVCMRFVKILSTLLLLYSAADLQFINPDGKSAANLTVGKSPIHQNGALPSPYGQRCPFWFSWELLTFYFLCIQCTNYPMPKTQVPHAYDYDGSYDLNLKMRTMTCGSAHCIVTVHNQVLSVFLWIAAVALQKCCNVTFVPRRGK